MGYPEGIHLRDRSEGVRHNGMPGGYTNYRKDFR